MAELISHFTVKRIGRDYLHIDHVTGRSMSLVERNGEMHYQLIPGRSEAPKSAVVKNAEGCRAWVRDNVRIDGELVGALFAPDREEFVIARAMNHTLGWQECDMVLEKEDLISLLLQMFPLQIISHQSRGSSPPGLRVN